MESTLKISKGMGKFFAAFSTWNDASDATQNLMQAFDESQSAEDRQAHLIMGSYKTLKTALDVLSVVPATAPAAGLANLVLTVGVDGWLEKHLFPKKGGGSEQKSESVIPCDPNDMTGPAGYGTGQFVTTAGTFPYMVRFFNDPQKASAPAQDVVITQTLDSDLDWSTFQLSNIMFGSHVVNVPPGLQTFQTSVDATNMDGSPLRVDITAGLNLQTGEVTWTFRSIDPATGTFPWDADAGFLPVNDHTGRGLGGVMYLIEPKPNLATGTQVNAQASIIFDTNAPLPTNIYTNTIDVGAPTSHVLPLPAMSLPSVNVSWDGDDDAGGSGIASYDVYVSDNGGDFTLWKDNTPLASDTFTGQVGHTYAFKCAAVDNIGHAEAVPPAAQATVMISIPNQVVFDASTGTVFVGGTSGADTIALASTGKAPALNLQVTMNKKVISKTISLASIQKIRVIGQEGNDTITVSNLTKSVLIDGNAGNDTITLASLGGAVTVDGGADTDKLIVTGAKTASTFSLNTTSLTMNGIADGFSNIESLAVNGGKAADVFTVAALPAFPVVFTGGGGADRLQGPDVANSWAITSATGGTLGGTLSFVKIPTLVGGGDRDTFTFSPRAKVSGKIDGGGGTTDTISYANYGKAATVNLQTLAATGTAGFVNIESFVGSATADTLIGASRVNPWNLTGPNAGAVNETAFNGFENLTGGTAVDTFTFDVDGSVSGKLDGGKGTVVQNYIVGPDKANVWALAGSNAGKLNGKTAFANIQNLTGGAQTDAFAFAKGAKLSGRIDGGGGRNRLDYGLYGKSVVVDLFAGTATGTAGIANIQDAAGGTAADTLTGDGQNNVLIGGGGNDTLAGNGGCDLLFGGDGADMIRGGLGEDLLFNGRTTFDTDWSVLDALRDYWTGVDDFGQRTNSLAAGMTSGGVYLKLDSSTVTNDKLVDSLLGAEDADWFFAQATDPGKDLLDLLAGVDRVN